MEFKVIDRTQWAPASGRNQAFLRIDHWNDYSFVTMFDVTLFDEHGEKIELGSVKIGFLGQTTAVSTHSTFEKVFTSLSEKYFSVGQDVDYYIRLAALSEPTRVSFLGALQDIVFHEGRSKSLEREEVFENSLMRSVSLTAVEGQFRRVLHGGVPLSDFDFAFSQPKSEKFAGIELDFEVTANSLPSTNIHALIGRNGVGKTTLLNTMISAVMRQSSTDARFLAKSTFSRAPIPPGYFGALVSVSFSAFDPFAPPREQADSSLGTRYCYIGLKDDEDDGGTLLKSLATLRNLCVESIATCFSDQGRRQRWLAAIKTLESDENFAHMDLPSLSEMPNEAVPTRAAKLVERMSSGHAIVLLTISSLVARVEEKTLILLDEPESHLHPPLLSAFTRALSELLHNRNGVAIIATHSPVVLQEVPRSCVHFITRSRLEMTARRPGIETFGENVGSLTREVFGLEVTQSGFHALLAKAVNDGDSYDDIVDAYKGQLGYEARGILRAMVAERDAEEARA